jgi:hypothetical protein
LSPLTGALRPILRAANISHPSILFAADVGG